MIYLDHNATSVLRPQVRAAMHAVEELPLNASSVHVTGRKAKQLSEGARRAFAEHVSVFAHEIIFTASATEANNMLLRALAPSHRLLVAASEHPCIKNTALQLGGVVIAVDDQGRLKLDDLDAKLAALAGTPALVSVMLVNNETGMVQDLAEIARITRAHGAKLHSDAVQAFGKMRIDAGLLGVDFLTFSAHKIGGPVGFGALVMRSDQGIVPLITGGGQERGYRAGTENIPAIIGAAELLSCIDIDKENAEARKLRTQLITLLRAQLPHMPMYAEQAETIGNTLMIGMPGVGSETQLIHCDMAGVAVSAGSACSSGKITPSHVLLAMGVPPDQAQQAIRVSLGWNSTEDDIQKFAKVWCELALRKASAA